MNKNYHSQLLKLDDGHSKQHYPYFYNYDDWCIFVDVYSKYFLKNYYMNDLAKLPNFQYYIIIFELSKNFSKYYCKWKTKYIS